MRENPPEQKTIIILEDTQAIGFIQKLKDLVLKVLNKEEKPDNSVHTKVLESLIPCTPPKPEIIQTIPGHNLKSALNSQSRIRSQCSQIPPNQRLTSKRRM